MAFRKASTWEFLYEVEILGKTECNFCSYIWSTGEMKIVRLQGSSMADANLYESDPEPSRFNILD